MEPRGSVSKFDLRREHLFYKAKCRVEYAFVLEQNPFVKTTYNTYLGLRNFYLV